MSTIIQRAGAVRRRLAARVGMARSGPDRVSDLTGRVEHLEAALEGLQDAVYRQDVVHDRQIADLRKGHPTPSDSRAPATRTEHP